MIRSRTIIIFISLSITLYGANYRKLHDCFIPMQNSDKQYMQCFTGQILQPIDNATFIQTNSSFSKAPTRLTSFVITRDVVTKKNILGIYDMQKNH